MDFIFDPSLVLYLPLYELDGASLMSKDAYGRLCTVTGAMWTPQGRSFDGGDDYIVLPNQAALNFGLGDFSLEAWIKADTSVATYRKIVNMDDLTSNRYALYVNQTSGSFIAEIRLDGTTRSANSGVAVNDNTWHHLVATFDRDGYIRDYIDGAAKGALRDTSDLASVDCSPNVNLYIGMLSGGSQFFIGVIGEVRIYNRALAPSEVLRNYLATKWRYR